MSNSKNNAFLTIPGAIIIAAAIIAIAIIYVLKPAQVSPTVVDQNAPKEIALSPVTASDHIYGNPNAKIKIIEYSDPSCPFCKLFHPTMLQVMKTYGPSGDVAWVYRHFPLDKPDQNGNILHKNAGHEAQAMECAAFIGGNDVFWKFVNRLYDVTPAVTQDTPQGLDQTQLPTIAAYAGIDQVRFNECLSSGQFKSKVEAQYASGLKAGVSGTPYNIVISSSGTKVPLAGAVSYTTIKAALDTLLQEK